MLFHHTPWLVAGVTAVLLVFSGTTHILRTRARQSEARAISRLSTHFELPVERPTVSPAMVQSARPAIPTPIQNPVIVEASPMTVPTPGPTINHVSVVQVPSVTPKARCLPAATPIVQPDLRELPNTASKQNKSDVSGGGIAPVAVPAVRIQRPVQAGMPSLQANRQFLNTSTQGTSANETFSNIPLGSSANQTFINSLSVDCANALILNSVSY